MTTIEFHRLEEYTKPHELGEQVIICSFKTERFGYVQVRLTELQRKYHGEVIKTWKFETLKNEPDLNMFTSEQKTKMEAFTRIVWKLVYDAPAATDRFES